eukprot:5825446-Pleurochrysis_carterae.AAC.2
MSVGDVILLLRFALLLSQLGLIRLICRCARSVAGADRADAQGPRPRVPRPDVHPLAGTLRPRAAMAAFMLDYHGGDLVFGSNRGGEGHREAGQRGHREAGQMRRRLERAVR